MQDDSEEEKKEERKSSKHAKNGKNGHNKREPLEGAVSKGTVSASKLANKRTQKEALKKIKNKRSKGTTKDVPTSSSAAQGEADASD